MNSEANNSFVEAQDIKGVPSVWAVVLNAQEEAILTYWLSGLRHTMDCIVFGK